MAVHRALRGVSLKAQKKAREHHKGKEMSENDGQSPDKLAEIVLRQGELRLQAQLQVALAADQRAVLLATILATAAAVALGFAAAWFGSIPAMTGLGFGGLITGLAFAGGAWLCGHAARPLPFGLVGAQPDKWWNDAVESRPLAECLRKESSNYQKRVTYNRGVLSRNAGTLRRGLRLAFVAPIFGFLTWAAARALV